MGEHADDAIEAEILGMSPSDYHVHLAGTQGAPVQAPRATKPGPSKEPVELVKVRCPAAPGDSWVAPLFSDCPRCGGHHADLLFRQLTQSRIGSNTHWAVCPRFKEPLLLEVES